MPRPSCKPCGGKKITATLRTDHPRLAADAMDAVVRGGIRCVEFTLTTPGALALIDEFSSRTGLPVAGRYDAHRRRGHGAQARAGRRAVEAGARFLVSPVMDPEIIAIAARLGVVVIPGVHTPSEMLTAHRLGAQLLKLFPAPAGGPAWLQSVLGPLPLLRVVPTNGVDADNAVDWLQAGAWSVGLVASLFDPDDLQARNFDAIEQRAARAVENVGVLARSELRRVDAIEDPFLVPV